MSQPVLLVALAGVALILTIVAPFGTGEIMRALPRLAYWAFVVIASYSIGFAANASVTGGLARRIALAGALTSLGVVPLVFLLNGLALGHWPVGAGDVAGALVLAGNISVICLVLAGIFQVAYSEAETPPETPPDLLDRLPIAKRGPLVSLSVEDHYVRIRTLKGEEMVLMRLADAVRETRGVPGLQVHRSHWVALGQVRGAARRGDGAVLTMSTGPEIPVSRANVAAIREAGLLPR
ncbi:MAG: LytTR family transcriptional regulator [Rhodobacteraceae bacterium]|nr:MAG: LytTR family transcriptional regulator [Paracoccaceae bacterium]